MSKQAEKSDIFGVDTEKCDVKWCQFAKKEYEIGDAFFSEHNGADL